MTLDIAIVLLLLVVAIVLFLGEWFAVDLVALGLVGALVLTGILDPAEAFSGFASEVIVVLGSIFVLAGALKRTGVMGWVAKSIQHLAGHREAPIVASVMALSAGLSAFLSNTNVTAVLLPGVLETARETRIVPSRLLMPLAYASMLGGSATLIGTSTNLAASGLMERLGMEGISLFELAPVGAAMTVVGIVYFFFLGRRLLPLRAAGAVRQAHEIRGFLSELVVEEEASCVGQTLAQADLASHGVQVLAVARGESRLPARAATRLQAGDLLLVQGSRESLLRLAERPGLALEAAPDLELDQLLAGDTILAEAVIMPGSPLPGRTLRESRFRQTYGASVLAVFRRGHSYPVAVSDLRLAAGDVLLLVAPKDRLGHLPETAGIWVLGEVYSLPLSRRKGLIALGALVAAIVAGAVGWLPLSVGLLLAALVAVAARCLAAEEVYRLVEWRILILIGGMTAFGLAMVKTGAADLLAQWIVTWTVPLGTPFVLAAFVALTMLLTQPMSNAAAALVVLPVAVSTAGALGVDPRPLAILVTLAASLSFIAPLEPACLLVYAPGHYTFRDFVKVGLPLSALVFVVLLLLVPVLWPLR